MDADLFSSIDGHLMRERCVTIGACVLAVLSSRCRGEPAPSVAPAATVSAPAVAAGTPARPGSAAPAPAPAPSQPAAPASATPSAAPAVSAAAPASSATAAADPDAEPALLGPDGAPLPQTEERPSVQSERFKRRMQRVADAIVSGDAEKARASFFPLVAYAQVKDVQKPERDYRYRLLSHFERDVREYRKALGRDAERAEFLGVSVPEERVEWMKPGKEGNRLGYFRVLRSRLRFRLPSGKEQAFELTSLISWRGEWYVVHLHGFE
jgi:hypothetical protein